MKAPPDQDVLSWFRVARRITRSSFWIRASSDAVKMLLFVLEEAQDPTNPHPGEVRMVGAALAHAVALPRERSDAALQEMLGPDAESLSGALGGAVLEPLTEDGRVIGYRLVNFDAYNPGAIENGAQARARRRREKAMLAGLVKHHGESKGREMFKAKLREEAEAMGRLRDRLHPRGQS